MSSGIQIKVRGKDVVQKSPRLVASKQNARLGGLATAARHDSEFRTARSEKGGVQTLVRYGRDYYRFIAMRRWNKSKAAVAQ